MAIGKRVGFIGSGQMAEALARGLMEKGMITGDMISCSDPSAARKELFQSFGEGVKILLGEDWMGVLNPMQGTLSPASGCMRRMSAWVAGLDLQHLSKGEKCFSKGGGQLGQGLG